LRLVEAGAFLKVIYTITPSWLLQKKDFIAGIQTLEKMGFSILNRRVPGRLPSPVAKGKEIHAAFRHTSAEIVLAQRGGYSAMKILPEMDFALLRRHPKILAGFSDVSALLNAVYERAGLVTLHAPMIINLSKPSRFTVRSFLNALTGFPEKNLFAGAPVQVFRPGTERGILKGGNLVTLTALLGTKWELGTEGAILFFEDVNEKVHEVDRSFTHWILARKLGRVKGIILGDFRGIKPKEVYRILSDQMKVPFPVVHCPNIGHVRNKITLPVGARVELNTAKKSLTIL
jgi:muramoyltetrapeptide carboxypeptidase